MAFNLPGQSVMPFDITDAQMTAMPGFLSCAIWGSSPHDIRLDRADVLHPYPLFFEIFHPLNRHHTAPMPAKKIKTYVALTPI